MGNLRKEKIEKRRRKRRKKRKEVKKERKEEIKCKKTLKERGRKICYKRMTLQNY